MKYCDSCKYRTCINEWSAARDGSENSRVWFKQATNKDRCECGNKDSAFFGNVVSASFACTKYKKEESDGRKDEISDTEKSW